MYSWHCRTHYPHYIIYILTREVYFFRTLSLIFLTAMRMINIIANLIDVVNLSGILELGGSIS